MRDNWPPATYYGLLSPACHLPKSSLPFSPRNFALLGECTAQAELLIGEAMRIRAVLGC